jgi:hypothetical protein
MTLGCLTIESEMRTRRELPIYNPAMPSDDLEEKPSPERDARDRRTANIFLLVAGVVLVAIGVWLANALVDARRADECLSSGRRNCNPIEAPPTYR